MAKKERIEAEVDIKTKGLSKAQSGIRKLRANWLDFAGDLAEPMILLASGATKAQAAWGGLEGIFITRVLGPMGMIAGASAALLAVTYKMVKAFKEMGMSGAAGLSRMSLEFRPLLGSIDLAKQRVQELYKFTASTPFRLSGVVKANKTLQSLTGGMLATKQGMQLVGDSAAVAGVGIDQTARSIGRLYDGLLSGRPVGEASMRLQELGLISGQTRNAIESMQAANVSGLKVWQMVESELARNKGAMKDLSAELEGLQSTLDDTRELAQAGFAKGFMKGEKETVKATTKAWEAMAPALEYLGEQLGSISNFFAGLKAKMSTAATGGEVLGNVIKFAANAFIVFNAAVLLAAGGSILKFLLGVRAVTRATAQQMTAMAADTGVKIVNGVVTKRLALAQARLGLAYSALTKGAFGAAAAQLKLAAAQVVASAKTNLAATSTGVFSLALKGLRVAIGFVITSLKAMAIALVMNPLFLFSAALLTVGAVLLHMANSAAKAAEALRQYKAASDAVISGLKAQRNAIQSVNDKRKQEVRALGALGDAYREEAKAIRDGDTVRAEVAANKIAAIKREIQATKQLNAEVLKRDKPEADQEERDFQAGENIKDIKEADELNNADADERVQILDDRAVKKREDFDAARADMEAERLSRTTQADLGMEGAERAVQLKSEIGVLESDYNAKRESAGYSVGEAALDLATGGMVKSGLGMGQTSDLINDSEMQDAIAISDQLYEKRQELAEIEANSGVAAQTESGLGSDSEIARLKASINLYTSLKKAKADSNAADQALVDAEAGDKDEDGFQEKVAEARSRAGKARADLNAISDVSDKFSQREVDPFDDKSQPLIENERQLEDSQLKLKRMVADRAEKGDESKVVEAEIEAKNAGNERSEDLATNKLDGEAAIAGLRLKGLEAEQRSLEFAREKLDLANKQGKIVGGEYESAKKVLQAKKDSLALAVAEAKASLVNVNKGKQGALQERVARADGDLEGVENARKNQDEAADDEKEKSLRKEAEKLTTDKGEQDRLVEQGMETFRGERDFNREQSDRDKELSRDRTKAEDVGGFEAEVLKARGQTKEAGRNEEDRQRDLDDVTREESRRKFRDDGFSADEADEMADRDVKVGQAQRAMDKLKAEGNGSVVASSLAKIGGGGGVSGKDPNTRILEKMEQLLKDIRDKEKEDVVNVF